MHALRPSPALGALLTIMVGSLVASCEPTVRTDRQGTGASAAASLSPADQEGIRAADMAFVAAANAGNLDGVVAVYAEDASLLPPNAPPQKGREAIRKFWGGVLGAYTVRFEVGGDSIDGRGDLAYSLGHYTLKATPKKKGPPAIDEEGKFVEILKRQPDGSWKYVIDMYSSNSPPK